MPIRKKGKHRRRADNSAARRRRKNSKRGKAKKRWPKSYIKVKNGNMGL